jgi:HAE1 family hydrophobic/amphiphilic exporter-1
MTLSDFSIKNPVFPVMLAAAMVVFGYLGYRELGISQFPEIDFPVVSIQTTREAASPDIVDGDVTDVIEDAVASVEGVDYISSQSVEGMSVVTVFFQLYRDVDVAMQDVQNAVSAAMSRLPTDIDPPTVSKVNFNKFPIMWLGVHGSRPIHEIADFVDNHLKQSIETIPGCGGLMFGGLRQRSMRLWVDSERLHAYDLDMRDLANALRREHSEKPAGYLQSESTEINVRTLGEARQVEEFNNLVIARKGSQLVRLQDVATIEDGLSDKRSLSRFNGIPTVGVGVMRAQGANVVAVCDAVKEKLPQMRRMLPEGMEIGISTDYSLFIKNDVNELKFALLMGVLLTSAVTFLFLGSLGTTLNICLSIPTSLVGTFCAMRYMGFTVNFMTLLALSLSVGVVVDDAILVLENIYRRCERGEDRRSASLLGSREIAFAAIAATLSIVAIFLPVAFLEGSIGRYFFQFGVTVSVAVILSLVTSLTLTPMLCAYFLKVEARGRPRPRRFGGPLGWLISTCSFVYWLLDRWILETLFVRPADWVMERLTRAYQWVLRWSLRHRWTVVVVSLLFVGLIFVFGFGITIPVPSVVAATIGIENLQIKPIGRELVPSEDQNRFVVQVICPVGSSVDYVDTMLAQCERVMAGMPEIATFFAAISTRPGQLITEGVLFTRLVDRQRRELSQAQVMGELRKKLARIPGMRAVVLDLSTQGFTATRGYPVDFAVQGPEWEQVTTYSQEIMKAMQESGVVSDVNSDYRPGMPEVRVIPNRQKASELGVSMANLAYTINAAVGGVRVGRFTSNGKRYDVRVRLLETQRDSPWDVRSIYLRSTKGKLISLAEVTELQTIPTLPVVNRYNHQRKVEITANMAPGVSQGVAIARCREIAEEILPPGYRIVPLGNSQAMQQTLTSLAFALGLGVVIAYMVLGVQFNSFLHPVTVLLAMPFAATGALATLWFAGDTLNLMSMIGLILLMGLVKKNSIILVDYTNQLRMAHDNPDGIRSSGLGLEEAVLTACPVRLRPILMTSIATIAAAVPLAVGFGPGSETRAPLARAIIGGIALSTLITLIVVPVFYVMFEHLTESFRDASRREPLPTASPPARPKPVPAELETVEV